MAVRQSVTRLRKNLLQNSAASSSLILSSRLQTTQLRRLAAVPPVTQNAVGSQGPTAMVFLNMGGPSTTDEVGDFLSRLFVRGIVGKCANCTLADPL